MTPSAAEFYRQLARIRRFEETLLENFGRGVFSGTTHTCLGQEANAVGVIGALEADDLVFSNHRGHGHFLAYGGSPTALFAELMGRAAGVSGGRGGSQHLHWRNFYSNGVQGGVAPVAVGMALAERRQGRTTVTVACLGDGTFGEGAVYEALNLAALWGAPILFMVEANGIAQTTPTSQALAGDLRGRFAAFGIPVVELESCDVVEIHAQAVQQIGAIRANFRPQALILHTARFGPHSKGDDTRPADAVAALRADRDPLSVQAARLPAAERAQIEAEAAAEIAAAFAAALASPFPEAVP
jgi:TPP-dependent pyruvate/acetoin dehydrogenase alpha subunit